MIANRSPVPEDKLVKAPLYPSVSFTLSTQVTLFSHLPNDVMHKLFSYWLSGTASFNLLRTSKNLFVSFKPTLRQLADHSLRKLLSHGALGELEQAEHYYSEDNSILTFCGTVYHPNRCYNDDTATWVAIPEEMSFGRYKYVQVTYLQILMMNEEWEEAIAVAKHMDMDEVVKQFNEVFPDGKIVKYDHDGKEWDFEKANQLLEALFKAVINDKVINNNDPNQMSGETRQARKAFFDYHKPNPEGHSKGLVSDPRSVEAALERYENKYFEFANDAQRRFWNVRVEEPLKSLLGTGFLRPCSQGLFKKKIHRKGCFLADGSYFAFRRSDTLLPGFHFWVNGHGVARKGEHCGRLHSPRMRTDFQIYVGEQRDQRETLCKNIQAQQNPGLCNKLK